MHNLIFKKFIKERAKLNNKDFNISDVYLYELLSGKNINDRQQILGFIFNQILNFLSIITIIKCKIFSIQKLNYIIVNNNSPTKIDFRSEKVIKKINLYSCLNLIRNKNFFYSIIIYFRYPNIIFYSGIESIFIGFKDKSNLNKIQRYNEYHKIIIQIRNFYEKIFLFLKLKKLLMIDDQRVYPFFLDISYKNNIKTFGYMHYKFTKYVVATSKYEFDHFLVWSDYFKNKLIAVNKNYKKKKLFYSKFKIKNFNNLDYKKDGVLYIFDLDSNLSYFKKFYNYLDKNKYTLYLKFKPQIAVDKSWKNFCTKNNISFFENDSLSSIIKNYKISIFVASISSLLLEATLYNCVPIKIVTSNDFFDDVVNDKVVVTLNTNNFYKINFLLQKILRKKIALISKIKKKVWSIKDNKNNINNFCYKFNS